MQCDPRGPAAPRRWPSPRAIAASLAVVLTAKLTDDEGNAIGAKLITFTLGTQGCSATTNASGIATCTIVKLTQKHGPYPLTSVFNGAADVNYNSASDTDIFKIQ